MTAPDQIKIEEPGIGATADLSLRVSTAVLTKTTFLHPQTGEEMLVLERKATAETTSTGLKHKLQAQPLGGGSRLLTPSALSNLVGKFNYDSKESAKEQDFRVQINPRDWPRVRDFCVRHFKDSSTKVVESDPSRELAEELGDALKIHVDENAYCSTNLGIVLQGAAASHRMGVSGQETVRVFNIYHVTITDSSLIQNILNNSDSASNESLISEARDKAEVSGKKGKASSLLVLPINDVVAAFQAAGFGDNWPVVNVKGNKISDSTAPILCQELSAIQLEQ